MLKKFFLSVLVLIVALTVVGFFLPKDFEVRRVQTMQATPEEVAAMVTDLPSWKTWSAWGEKKYPKCAWVFPEDGKTMLWDGPDAGKGRLIITEVSADAVRWDLIFGEKDAEMASKGGVTFTAAPDGTQVTWFMTGRLEGPIGGWMTLSVDRMLGSSFEQNLDNIADLLAQAKGAAMASEAEEG